MILKKLMKLKTDLRKIKEEVEEKVHSVMLGYCHLV